MEKNSKKHLIISIVILFTALTIVAFLFLDAPTTAYANDTATVFMTYNQSTIFSNNGTITQYTIEFGHNITINGNTYGFKANSLTINTEKIPIITSSGGIFATIDNPTLPQTVTIDGEVLTYTTVNDLPIIIYSSFNIYLPIGILIFLTVMAISVIIGATSETEDNELFTVVQGMWAVVTIVTLMLFIVPLYL